MISDKEILEIKSKVSLVDLIRSYGIDLKKKGKSYVAHCPFHKPDKDPSFMVDPAKGLWNCLGGCRGNGEKTGGDAIYFVMRKEGIGFRPALEKLRRQISGVVSTAEPTLEPANAPGRAELLGRVVEYYHKTLLESKEGLAYLRERGLEDGELIRDFKLGYSDGTLLAVVPEKGDLVERLCEIGLLTKQGKEFFLGCVVVPIYDLNSSVANLYGRHVHRQQHLYLPGRLCGVLNWPAAKSSTELIVSESILDALSLYKAGFKNAIAIYGANGWTSDHDALIERYRTRRVYLCLDSDGAGQAAAETLGVKLKARGIEVAKIALPVKDANEFFCTVPQARTVFKQLLEQAPVEQGLASERPDSEAENYNIEEIENGFVYRSAGRSYRVRGLSLYGLEHLRANVRVEAGGLVHIDTIDLYSSRQRAGFAKRAAEALKEKSEGIEAELLKLVEAVEWMQSRKAETKSEKPIMSAPEKEEALELLRSLDLMNKIVAAMDRLGYVGEEANKQLLYLVSISRKLEEPLSAIILSQSGAGKSSLAEVIEQMTPPEDVVLYSRITPQALYYMDRDYLKRKLLIIEERAGSADADYSIRTLQSRKRLVLATPIKDPTTGKTRTYTITVEGPAAYIETTADVRVNPENATRCFEVYMDETVEQTVRIHQVQRDSKTLAGLLRRAEMERILRAHHNAQRLLRPLRVEIPYAPLLVFPTQWLRTRRDHLRFLNLVEAMAFLHQYQREVKTVNDIEYIEATVADYERAYELACELLAQGLSDLKKPARDLLTEIADRVLRLEKEKNHKPRSTPFTRRHVREWTGWPDHQVRRLLSDLVDLEYLQIVRGANGLAYQYQLPEEDPVKSKPLKGLLTADQLQEKVQANALSASSVSVRTQP